MNDKTKTYTVANWDVEIKNGRVIIDNKVLINDFGLREDESLHNARDYFDSPDNTAYAFG